MNKEELDFQGKVEITIETIFIFLFKIFLSGSILLIIIAILTFNSVLVYPTYGKTNEMLIQIFVLGVLFMIIFKFIKRRLSENKKKFK